MKDTFTRAHKIIRHLSFINNPVLAGRILSGYFNTVILRRNTLRSIELAVTYQCQASCHKCYAANLLSIDRSYLSLKQIKETVDQAMSLGLIHVNITGGEPFLRSDLFDIVGSCRPREIMVSLVTNGMLLTREKMRVLKQLGLNTIQISLDSASRDIHDKLRGMPGCYDKVMAGASWAREFSINLCFSTVLANEPESGISEMYKLLDLARKEKAFLLICDSAAVGGWEDQREKMMTRDERNSALKELMRHPNARHHNMYNFRMRVGCPAGGEKIYISAYGDVMPCDLIHNSFGNVLRENLGSIWKRMCHDFLYSKKHFDCVRYLDEFNTRKTI